MKNKNAASKKNCKASKSKSLGIQKNQKVVGLGMMMRRVHKMGSGDTTKRTHLVLNSEFRNYGRVLQDRIAGNKTKVVLANPPKHKSNFFQDILDAKKVPNFEDKYRKRWKAQDELFSTSSVRELMQGLIERHTKKPFTANEKQHINDVFNNISRVRIATEYSGYALSSTDRMQHPTAAGKGYFADAAKTMSQHYELDRQRKQHISDVIGEEANVRGRPFESVMNAALRAALAFTLNNMNAPSTASDVRPHAIKGNSNEAILNKQLFAREELKSLHVQLGGTQESDGGASAADRRSRPWAPRRTTPPRRSVSPPRS